MNKLFFMLVASSLFFISCNADENVEKQFRLGVLKKIVEKAEKDFPGNYIMQMQQIKYQTEALLEITEIKKMVEKL